ncbi:hypothetical protein LI950_07535 [Cutibacterium acnes]|uniref:hypothetical protein n=1 Tax=Cutibacterium acnes TaxID=1747 RepID=UPI001E56993C|nr:hypothetical protein [Cutibacterium acnes]MCD1062037.1 hypothetical protein [Cutibacterium acnes]MCD1089069.1 hypothetical protein [Cutibacterium acnes]MCD1093455.1 hypothetical protein [Cutibacterium acnes]MCD1143045.1 hypothetical protein [Cutibacterium acnes]
MEELTLADFNDARPNKALPQINLVRTSINHISERVSFTLTSGILSRDPIPKGSAADVANAFRKSVEGGAIGTVIILP